MDIGFIGLGHMGGGMARNLIKAGHQLTVFDLSAPALKDITALGAISVESPQKVAQASDIVITMLPAAAHVRTVYTGEAGVLSGVRTGARLIDCSTIDPQTARDVAALAQARDCHFADAPVSGGTIGAQSGTLTFMVGAPGFLFTALEPVLQCMGKRVVHCGDIGTGQIAKICNNMILGVSMAAVAEAMSLGHALGIDPTILAGIVNSSTGRCWASEVNNPWPGVVENAPAGRGYTGGFGTALMLKDLGLATQAARQINQPNPLGGLAEQLYRQLNMAGHGGEDFSSIVKLYTPAGGSDHA